MARMGTPFCLGLKPLIEGRYRLANPARPIIGPIGRLTTFITA
jgi:hypothetical protein